jgi:preprotein translocase subunit SecD
MNSKVRLQFILITVVTLVAAYVALPIPNKPGLPFQIHRGMDLAGGAELRYKLLFHSEFKGDRQQALREAAEVLRRRMESKQLKEPRISTYGDDEIILQLPGVDADELRDCKRLIETAGTLELYAAAPDEIRERAERDRLVPDGYKWVGHGLRGSMLVEEHPVVVGRNLLAAEARQDAGIDGASWGTAFDLDSDGARRFDEAAERLYVRHPRGRIVVVLDDQIRSVAVVNAPAFYGRGLISGAAPK